MCKKVFPALIFIVGFWISAQAQQECSLAIGATESDTIIQIFQLKEKFIRKPSANHSRGFNGIGCKV